jgi:beta-aspartyl-peptidase (threonine type)
MLKGRILVHGGAGRWEEGRERDNQVVTVLRGAAEAGLSAMKGGSAVDAVVEAVALLEDSGVLNAGLGAVLNLAGGIELDAGIMDGGRMRAGGAAAVRTVPHPIRLARAVMERTENVLVVGTGAEELARLFGLAGDLPPLDARRREYESGRRSYLTSPDHRWVMEIFSGPGRAREGDTVGAVAIDGEGRLAAGTSTGGLPFKLPGRVGDSSLVGHGFYAMRGAGAASTSGIGEAIAHYGLSLRAVLSLGRGTDPQTAVREAIGELTALFGSETAGIILLDRSGSPGISFNTRGMAVGYGGEGIEAGARILRREELEEFSQDLSRKMPPR